MQELRFVAVSEDGRYAVLAVPGRSARFTLPIDERLRAVALGQTSRLVQYEIEVESPLRPKEIQARIRAGETVEEIADAAGIAVERVRWFEGPVLAERAYVADQAQAASVRRHGDATPSTPGPRLGEIVTERLKAFGSDPEEAQWDAKKRGDGSWQVQLTFISGGRLHEADWIFDPRRRHVLPADDNAARMSLPGGELPQPAAPPPGEATVTQLAPRLSTAAGQSFGQPGTGTSGFSPAGLGNPGFANGGSGNGGPGNGGLGNGRARHERPGSVRPAVPESAPSAPSTTAASAAPPTPTAPVSESIGDAPRIPVSGRHSTPMPPPQETEPRNHEVPVASTPAAAAPPTPASSPVTPAAIAADVSKAAQAARPGQSSQPGQRPQPAARASQPTQRVPEPGRPQSRPEPVRSETAVPPVRQDTRAPEPVAPAAPAAASAEPGSEQVSRQSRKAARAKRASVPSWDEIMFGNTRQRD
jgi:Protein of unknown function (DUF3071)